MRLREREFVRLGEIYSETEEERVNETEGEKVRQEERD